MQVRYSQDFVSQRPQISTYESQFTHLLPQLDGMVGDVQWWAFTVSIPGIRYNHRLLYTDRARDYKLGSVMAAERKIGSWCWHICSQLAEKGCVPCWACAGLSFTLEIANSVKIGRMMMKNLWMYGVPTIWRMRKELQQNQRR
jgi:hypothetical protein